MILISRGNDPFPCLRTTQGASPQLGQLHSLISAACHGAVSVGMGADTPALTDVVALNGVTEFSVYPGTAPDIVGYTGVKK